MKRSDLAEKTVAELKALAKKNNVSLSARARKTDIIDALLAVAKSVKPAAKKVVVAVKTAAKKSVAAVKNITRSAVPAKPPVQKAVQSQKSAPARTAAAKKTAAVKKDSAASPVHEWKLQPGVEEPLLAQERIAEAKYYTGPVAYVTAVGHGELPQGYHEDRITILSRDPFVAYAYWEATPARIEREKSWFGWDSKFCVRVYDITGVQFDGRNAIGYFDQEVADRIGSWYFDFGRPTHSFCADLGLLSPGGRFLTLARSNYITMPRDGVSEVIDEEWMLMDEEFWSLYGHEGSQRGISSPEMQELLKRRRELEISSPGLFARERAKRK